MATLMVVHLLCCLTSVFFFFLIDEHLQETEMNLYPHSFWAVWSHDYGHMICLHQL